MQVDDGRNAGACADGSRPKLVMTYLSPPSSLPLKRFWVHLGLGLGYVFVETIVGDQFWTRFTFAFEVVGYRECVKKEW